MGQLTGLVGSIEYGLAEDRWGARVAGAIRDWETPYRF
jgi:hypothetical protein